MSTYTGNLDVVCRVERVRGLVHTHKEQAPPHAHGRRRSGPVGAAFNLIEVRVLMLLLPKIIDFWVWSGEATFLAMPGATLVRTWPLTLPLPSA